MEKGYDDHANYIHEKCISDISLLVGTERY